MRPTEQPIEKFVIVGGGTSGWLAATILGNVFKDSAVAIELVESEDINVIGVGEATIPPLLDTLQSVGIDLVDFVKATQATFKLGIEFENWHTLGHSYFHPFGDIGRRIDGHEFYQCWLKLKAHGDTTPLMAYSPEAVLATTNHFFEPHKSVNTPLAGTRYALHLDAVLAGRYLREHAKKLGVQHTIGHVEAVSQNENGEIASLTLLNGEVIHGDFFIDCSGFNGILIDKTLNTPYQDWSQFLPCNRAVAVQTTKCTDTKPYTVSRAQTAGWSWHIPLQNRIGNGYVFCDKYISDDEAINTLLQNIEGEPLTEPRVIPFVTGVRDKIWHKNCLSLGLAQGFLEPLESTAIHLVAKSLALFVRMFPTRQNSSVLQNEFNRRMLLDYEEIRDFLVLHYKETARNDSAFWRDWQQRDVPASLAYKARFFKHAGGLIPEAEALFQSTSWYAVFDGMGVQPATYNPTLDALDVERLKASLNAGRTLLQKTASEQLSHDQFIATYCQAPSV